MVKVKITYVNTLTIDLPIESFEEIAFDRMTQKESDNYIGDYVSEHLGINMHNITDVREVK